MKTLFLLPTALLILVAGAAAQEARSAIIAEGGNPDERASARVLYWNTKADAAAGEFAIDYGRPAWKKDYEDPAKFDAMTKGKVWRMGSNFWTALDTSLPLKIGGKSVRVGEYYLGLRRSANGEHWSLAFVEPAKVRRARLDGFEIGKAAVEFEAPMSLDKTSNTVERLTITLSYPKESPKNVTLKVAWGSLALTAPIEVSVPE
jgi:hypothetical protein